MKTRILIVDDDDLLRDMLRRTLLAKGYEVTVARNGIEALRAVAQEPPDLVLTDLMMPEKEGVETIMTLARQHPQVKIVAMSGGGRCAAGTLLQVARRLGAQETLAKPFSSDELELAIARALAPRP